MKGACEQEFGVRASKSKQNPCEFHLQPTATKRGREELAPLPPRADSAAHSSLVFVLFLV